MGLVDVVVGVLAKDDGFDCVEGRMARPTPMSKMRTGIQRKREREREVGKGVKIPRVDILRRGKDRLAGLLFLLQEPLELQEFIAQHFVFQLRQPCLVQSVDL